MNKKLKTILTASLLVIGMAAQACTLGAWDSNLSSTALAGGPGDANNDFARYEGLCAMQTAGNTPSVKNSAANNATSGPSGEETMIVRFYFLPGGVTGKIFEAYSDDGTTPVYTVSYTGTNVTVTPVNGGSPASVAVGGTSWHSVEISWLNNGRAIDMWVDTTSTTDGGATTETPSASTTSEAAVTTINSVMLGGVSGIIFDAYESRRSTAIGRLIVGNASNGSDELLSISDVAAIISEINNFSVAPGMPDCNESGGLISISDVACVISIINNQ